MLEYSLNEVSPSGLLIANFCALASSKRTMMSASSLQILPMDFSGPGAIDQAIEAGIDLDGSQIPVEMLKLYKEVMDQEGARKRSGVKKSMRNRIVRSGAKHFDQETLNQRLIAAGWEGLKSKEIAFFFG